MWILARILIAIGAALYRGLFRRIPSQFNENFNGTPYAYWDNKNKSGEIVKRYVEIPFEAPLVCCFQRETSFDRFLLSIGIGDEMTTHDADFDDQIYIVGDHPSLARYLQGKNAVRSILMKSIGKWLRSVSITGKTLRFEIDGAHTLSNALPNCIELLHELGDIQSAISSRFNDTFYVRALIAESIVWGICGYAISTVMEWLVYKEDYHLFPSLLIPRGLVIAGALLCLGVIFLIKFLGRSSHAPRIIGESMLLLLFALPVTGIELLSDINRGMDSSPGVEIVRPVSHAEKRLHRGRRGRTYYTYHLYFDYLGSDQLPGMELPSRMEVNSSIYNSSMSTKKVTVTIAPGYLNIPWYRKTK